MWRTLSKANGLSSNHYSSPFFLIIKLSQADPCSPRPISLHGVAHSFHIELAQALITPQHSNPEKFRGVVVIRRLESVLRRSRVQRANGYISCFLFQVRLVLLYRLYSYYYMVPASRADLPFF
jgi:hypothetical protein